MRVKEINPGELIAKENNIGILLISIALTIAGVFMTLNITFANFDASEVVMYVGPALAIIGVALFLFAWRRKKVIFSKNNNQFLISSKSILNTHERKGLVEDIDEIAYTELISMGGASGSRGRPSTQVHKMVEMRLRNGEVHTIFENSGSHNPLFNRTKRNAEKIADFLGLPLQTFTTRDAFKARVNMGRSQMNQNQPPGFNPNQNNYQQSQQSQQQPQQQDNQNQTNFQNNNQWGNQ